MRKPLFAMLALLASAGFGHAAQLVTGSIWFVPDSVARDAAPSSVPLTTPDVTFSADAVNFSSFQGTGTYTIGGFLNALNANPATIFLGSSHLGDNMNDTIWDFQGTVSVTTGQVFTVSHDDGLTLIIGGSTVIDEPGPFSPTTDSHTYTGPTGTFAFDLVYGECCGAPAQLIIDLPLVGGEVVGETPIPAALPLFAGGLGLLGFLGRRRNRAAAAA